MTTTLPAPVALRGQPPPMRPEDEALKRAQLSRMKRIAGALLIVSTLVFVAARALEHRYPWLAFVRATAEAAMVGGIADWFAVTALFRHPLGIPIPHTAIVPAKKDQVGRSLGNFVQRNFLSRDALAIRLQSMRVAEHLGRWISDPENSRRIARHAASGLATATQVLKEEEVQRLIDSTVATKVRTTQVAPLLGKALELVTAGDRHQELFDEVIVLLARGIERNHELIRQKIADESPWWIPEAVDDRIHAKIVTAIERTLHEIHDDEDHPIRARFDAGLRDFVVKLQSEPAVIERAEQIKHELLSDDVIRRFSISLWEDVKSAIASAAERSEEYAPGPIEKGLNAFGDALLSDPVLLEKVDRWIADVALHLVERYEDEVSQLISQTVSAWDPEATSRRIELAIGRDLQYIRINGTLVGGLAGLLIYSLSLLF